jgi:hypothetical protein
MPCGQRTLNGDTSVGGVAERTGSGQRFNGSRTGRGGRARPVVSRGVVTQRRGFLRGPSRRDWEQV